MSNFIAEPSQVRNHSKAVLSSIFSTKYRRTDDDTSSSTAQLPHISLTRLIDPWGPWVIVNNGSFLGYFDWIPLKYRIGAWHPFPTVTFLSISLTVFSWTPRGESKSSNMSCCESNNYFSSEHSYFLWFCSLCLHVLMIINLVIICTIRTPAVIATFTMQSWLINATRLGIQATIPFVTRLLYTIKSYENLHAIGIFVYNWMIDIHRFLRFPAIATATTTFVCWNFLIGPYLYILALSTQEKRRFFIRWNFSFNLVQIHFCNIFYSFVNVFILEAPLSRHTRLCDSERVSMNPTLLVSSPSNNHEYYYQPFICNDLRIGLSMFLLYGILYYLLLDRLGIHIYGPLFSPRNKYSSIVWVFIVGLYSLSFHILNNVTSRIMNQRQRIDAADWEKKFVFSVLEYGTLIFASSHVFSWIIRRFILHQPLAKTEHKE